jgi:hypothetical protein
MSWRHAMGCAVHLGIGEERLSSWENRWRTCRFTPRAPTRNGWPARQSTG